MAKSLAVLKDKLSKAGYFVVLESSQDIEKMKQQGGVSLAEGLGLMDPKESKLATCRFLGSDFDLLNCNSTILVVLPETALTDTGKQCDGEKVFRADWRVMRDVSYVAL